MIDWHRLFGIALILHFAKYPLMIELEKEMAIKRQILDVLIMKKGDGPLPGRMPDGLEDLAPYNLLTYKSLQEALDDWTLKELTGHYVNYRKVVSPSLDKLLPEDQFRMLAVSTRYPQKLANQSGRNWQKLQKGVYQIKRGSDIIRVIVLKEIPKAEHNLIWQLFSAQEEKVQDAARRYFGSNSQINTIINGLLTKYKVEGIHMPYTLEDYRKDSARWVLNSLTLEERLAGLALEERLAGVAPEEVLTHYEPKARLAGLAPEERLAGLAPEERLAGLAPEERLAGLTLEELLAVLSAKDRESLTKRLLSEQGGGSSVS